MLDLIKENVVKPSLTRLGFALTGWMVGMGINGDYAHMVATGVIGVGLVTTDLLLAYARKKGIQKKATLKALGVTP